MTARSLPSRDAQNELEAHEITPLEPPPSRLLSDHELPLKTAAPPCPSEATQNEEDAHDTTPNAPSELPTGSLQVLPLNTMVSEAAGVRAVATQNVGDAHDTDSSTNFLPTGVSRGSLHELPLKVA